MSFYITLPSNGADYTSLYGKKHNSLTDFSTDLKEPIVFNNYNYEVALVECSYRKNWLVNYGNIGVFTYVSGKPFFIETVNINMYDGITISLLLASINEKLNSISFIHDQVTNRVTVNFKINCNLHINGYLAHLLSYFLIEYKVNIANVDKSLDEVKNVRKTSVIQSLEGIPELTLISHDKFDFKFRLYTKIMRYVEEIFVGTNIVKESHVGRSMAPLLKTLTDTSDFDQIVSHQILNPHYILVNNKTIDRIRIYMHDSNGDTIKFGDRHSRVIYKLHFRQIEKN